MAGDRTENINNSNIDIDTDPTIEMKASEVKDARVRQRIDDLLERKRLKALLDDCDDW